MDRSIDCALLSPPPPSPPPGCQALVTCTTRAHGVQNCNASMQVSDTATKLYKLHEGQGFALEAANADPHFFDLNEDSPGTPPRWYLEVSCSALLCDFVPTESCDRVSHVLLAIRSLMWRQKSQTISTLIHARGG